MSGSLHYFTDVVLLVGARGKRGCAYGCAGGDVEEREKYVTVVGGYSGCRWLVWQ